MFEPPLDLARARILISNDDGIDAPGLKVLEKVAREIAREVWVVAPETEQSGAGHSLTLRRPLRIRHVSGRRYAVDGTPTDCVMLAVKQIMKGRRPDLVLSGINRGGNLGEDMTYSGTIAAAMEGTLMGIPSIALSQHCDDRSAVHWGTAQAFAAEVIRKATSVAWPRNTLVNVNFPSVAASYVSGIEVTAEGRRKIGDEIKEGIDPRGMKYYWIGAQRDEERFRAGTDLEAVYRGAVSVTPVSLDMTDHATLIALRAAFD